MLVAAALAEPPSHPARELLRFLRTDGRFAPMALGVALVLVVERGRPVEDGPPNLLVQRSDSRYRALLTAEKTVERGLWSRTAWRRLRFEAGRLVENPERT